MCLREVKLRRIFIAGGSKSNKISLVTVQGNVNNLSGTISRSFCVRTGECSPADAITPRGVHTLENSFEDNINVFVAATGISSGTGGRTLRVSPDHPVVIMSNGRLMDAYVSGRVKFAFGPMFDGVTLSGVVDGPSARAVNGSSMMREVIASGSVETCVLILPHTVGGIVPRGSATVAVDFSNVDCGRCRVSTRNECMNKVSGTCEGCKLERPSNIFMPGGTV